MSKVLGFKDTPYEISNDIILELKNRYEDNIKSTINEKLNIGDKVKFIHGPFVDLIANIEAVDENNRIWVILEAIGQYKKEKAQQTDEIILIIFKY